MRKHYSEYSSKNRNWRKVYSDCTFNMACFQLEFDGFKFRSAIHNGNLTYINGFNPDGYEVNYVWDDAADTLYAIDTHTVNQELLKEVVKC